MMLVLQGTHPTKLDPLIECVANSASHRAVPSIDNVNAESTKIAPRPSVRLSAKWPSHLRTARGAAWSFVRLSFHSRSMLFCPSVVIAGNTEVHSAPHRPAGKVGRTPGRRRLTPARRPANFRCLL